jgi:hypothetical protein
MPGPAAYKSFQAHRPIWLRMGQFLAKRRASSRLFGQFNFFFLKNGRIKPDFPLSGVTPLRGESPPE